MVDSICREIVLTEKKGSSGQTADTIYFGGGTPSILTAGELGRIMETVKNAFPVDRDAEITLEANPDDISPAALDSWLNLGINRLSLGVQSFAADELKWMNRAHDAKDSTDSIRLIKQAGFSNYSIDLIYGSPLQSDNVLERNLDIIFGEAVPHVSCYALTVEGNTLLHHRVAKKKSADVDMDKQAEQFLRIMQRMETAGYEHYEISNYARPGMRSRHNSSYWQGKPYHGFGPSAHSFDGLQTRRWNLSNNALYIKSLENGIIPSEAETLTADQQANEYIMTSLRTMEGLDLQYIHSSFGHGYENTLVSAVKKYLVTGKLNLENNRITLTREGKLFADGIAADLFF